MTVLVLLAAPAGAGVVPADLGADPDRLGLSARHVTVSTVGLPKQIRRLAGEDIPITLAISLHAPNDALRRRLIPPAPTRWELKSHAFYR